MRSMIKPSPQLTLYESFTSGIAHLLNAISLHTNPLGLSAVQLHTNPLGHSAISLHTNPICLSASDYTPNLSSSRP